MSFIQVLIFAIILCCNSVVLCENKICDFEDVKCMSDSAKIMFVKLVTRNGLPGVRPSDPLHLDVFEAKLPSSEYKLVNATLTGMKHCTVANATILPKEPKYIFNVGCPHLTLYTMYEIKGKSGSEYDRGTTKIDFDGFHFHFHGDYDEKKYKDGKLYLHWKTYILKVESTDKVHYSFKNSLNDNKEQSDIDADARRVDTILSQPTLEAFMKQLGVNINAYFEILPAEKVFFYQ